VPTTAPLALASSTWPATSSRWASETRGRRRGGVERVTHHEVGHGLAEALEELVGELVDHDERLDAMHDCHC